jgi:hypothetical protein
MVRNIHILILTIVTFLFSVIDSFAQSTKIDTTSISIEVFLVQDTITKNDTVEITVKFINNQHFPVSIQLGNSLRLPDESSISDYLKFVDGGIKPKKIELKEYEQLSIKLNVVLFDFLYFRGENRIRFFYFHKHDDTRYFSFSQPLTVFKKD